MEKNTVCLDIETYNRLNSAYVAYNAGGIISISYGEAYRYLSESDALKAADTRITQLIKENVDLTMRIDRVNSIKGRLHFLFHGKF